MEQWTIIKDTDHAAAYGTLGMPIRIMRGLDIRSSKESSHFGVGLQNLDGTEKTKRIQSLHRKGALEKKEPMHAFLVVLAAFENRERLLDCANRGTMISLVRPGGRGPCRYVLGSEGLPGLRADVPVLKTGDLKLVAALGVIGLPVLRIDGSKGNYIFYVQAFRRAGAKSIDGGALMAAWRADPESIPWAEPFAQAMRGLRNRERLLDAINRTSIDVTLLQHKGGRSAVVRADAAGNVNGEAMDKVSEFFD
ncbi:MAG: hypothetical protein QM680_06555 [Luteolibacter sp.]